MDANERSVQIELDSKNKIISVPRQRVAESSQENKRESDALSQRQAGSMDRMAVPQGMRTPGPTHGYPPATPSRMLNSQTPNRGQSFGNNSPPIFDPARGGLQNPYEAFRQLPSTPAVHDASADGSIGGMAGATADTLIPTTPGPMKQPTTPMPQTPMVKPGTPHVPYSGVVNGPRRGERLQGQDAGS